MQVTVRLSFLIELIVNYPVIRKCLFLANKQVTQQACNVGSIARYVISYSTAHDCRSQSKAGAGAESGLKIASENYVFI